MWGTATIIRVEGQSSRYMRATENENNYDFSYQMDGHEVTATVEMDRRAHFFYMINSAYAARDIAGSPDFLSEITRVDRSQIYIDGVDIASIPDVTVITHQGHDGRIYQELRHSRGDPVIAEARRALSAANPADGGFFVPEELNSMARRFAETMVPDRSAPRGTVTGRVGFSERILRRPSPPAQMYVFYTRDGRMRQLDRGDTVSFTDERGETWRGHYEDADWDIRTRSGTVHFRVDASVTPEQVRHGFVYDGTRAPYPPIDEPRATASGEGSFLAATIAAGTQALLNSLQEPATPKLSLKPGPRKIVIRR